jgi:hypothetical protein
MTLKGPGATTIFLRIPESWCLVLEEIGKEIAKEMGNKDPLSRQDVIRLILMDKFNFK